jgi:hypothetical protein
MSAMTVYAQNQAQKAPNAPHIFHEIANNGATQAQENLDETGAVGAVATSFKGVEDYSKKVLEFTNININAAFEHASKLSIVTSPVKLFTMSDRYLRQQLDAFSRQAQELAGIVEKMTTATTNSIETGPAR